MEDAAVASVEVKVPQPDQKPKGYAPIKKEYLASDHVRQLAVEFMPKDVAKELTDQIVSEKDGSKKPEKLKGRNRNNERPIFKAAQHNLCTYAARCFEDEKCPFGEACRNSHDLSAYMPKREQDIGEKCYNFDTFGRCRFGVLCRFGSSHITDDGTNIIDEEKWAKFKDSSLTFNELTKDLQTALRKRTLQFPKTKEFNVNRSKSQKLEPAIENPEDSVSAPNVPKELMKEEPRIGIECCDCTSAGRRVKVNHMICRPYLSPLTTVGNLPFRRICTEYGAEVTCGEMAMVYNLLQGHAGEWALLRRHESERCFGVQLCGGNPDTMARCAEMISEKLNVDFIDINAACPLDLVCQRGEGASLMARPPRLLNVVKAVRSVTSLPLSVKIRTGMGDKNDLRTAHEIVPMLADAGADFVALHGRTRDQRYTRLADWDYVDTCAKIGAEKSFPLFGVGDVLSYEDYYNRLDSTSVSGVVVARGALIKPWIFTEISERRHWDISSSERLDMLRRFGNYGLEHWGSDTRGVETTRRFMLEWLSFLCRYIPVGLLEVLPQRINERPPPYYGRDDLETLMASQNCADWIKISQMILGPVPDNFTFLPKHKANAYQ